MELFHRRIHMNETERAITIAAMTCAIGTCVYAVYTLYQGRKLQLKIQAEMESILGKR